MGFIMFLYGVVATKINKKIGIVFLFYQLFLTFARTKTKYTFSYMIEHRLFHIFWLLSCCLWGGHKSCFCCCFSCLATSRAYACGAKTQRTGWVVASSRHEPGARQEWHDMGGNMERTEPIRRLSLRILQAEARRWMLDGREPHQGHPYSGSLYIL